MNQETTVTGILIDPEIRRLALVNVAGRIEDGAAVANGAGVLALLGCERFDVARLDDGVDCWINDTGLMLIESGAAPVQSLFFIAGHHGPLQGRALILGCDDATGSSVACPWTLREAAERVDFVTGLIKIIRGSGAGDSIHAGVINAAGQTRTIPLAG